MREELKQSANYLRYAKEKLNDLKTYEEFNIVKLDASIGMIISADNIINQIIGQIDLKYELYDSILDNVVGDHFKSSDTNTLIDYINSINKNIEELEQVKNKTKIQIQLLDMYKKMKELQESILIYKTLEE